MCREIGDLLIAAPGKKAPQSDQTRAATWPVNALAGRGDRNTELGDLLAAHSSTATKRTRYVVISTPGLCQNRAMSHCLSVTASAV